MGVGAGWGWERRAHPMDPGRKLETALMTACDVRRRAPRAPETRDERVLVESVDVPLEDVDRACLRAAALASALSPAPVPVLASAVRSAAAAASSVAAAGGAGAGAGGGGGDAGRGRSGRLEMEMDRS